MTTLNRPYTTLSAVPSNLSSSVLLPNTAYNSSSLGAYANLYTPLGSTYLAPVALPAPDRVKDLEAAYKKLREAGSDEAKSRGVPGVGEGDQGAETEETVRR